MCIKREPMTIDFEIRRTQRAALEEIKRLRDDLKQSERVIKAKMECIDEQAARIQKLEDILVDERAYSLERCGYLGSFPKGEKARKLARSQLYQQGIIP